MWIEREISPKLREIAASFPALVLVGPRQVGKTSLLERIFPDYTYVSLDVASYAEMAETQPQEFLQQFKPPIVLDEIQYAPAFFRYIKTYIDQHRGQNGLFILTGSQNYALMAAVTDSLAGRAAVIPMLGISGLEWQACAPIQIGFDWKEFLWRGSYPALWANLDNAPTRDRWYQGYVTTYLERDVRSLLNVGSLRDFERFIRVCATRCGQLLNMSDIGRDVGISATTAKEWISVLQASNLIYLLEPYYRSLGKRLSKTPKLYFSDTGLASYLMGFQSATSLWQSQYAGAMWENYVVSQWLRWRDSFHPAVGIWYWRDQQGSEVDLLLEIDQKLIAIECKISEKPVARDQKGIMKCRDFYGDNMIQAAYIACTTKQSFTLSQNVIAQNAWTVWNVLDK